MVRVKICGIKRLADALAAVEAGAHAIGLNFWRPGKRYVAPEMARVIARSLPPFITRVGVFVDEDPETVEEIADLVGLDVLQFHGRESPEYCDRFDRPVIKAIPVRGPGSLRGLEHYHVAAWLLDAHVPGHVGGTGHTFDWALENVIDAIRAATPFAVDVASGVETNGEKDPAKIREFVARVHAWNIAEVRP